MFITISCVFLLVETFLFSLGAYDGKWCVEVKNRSIHGRYLKGKKSCASLRLSSDSSRIVRARVRKTLKTLIKSYII